VGSSSFAAENDSPLRRLGDAGADIVPNVLGRRLTEDEIIGHLEGVDGLLAGLEPLNRHVLESAPKLKAIARVGIGMDNVDLEAAEELGIRVSNTPDEPAAAVAEMTLAALLSLARGIVVANSDLHAGRWNKGIGRSIAELCVLIVGYGRIGAEVAALLKRFGAKILVADPFVEDSRRIPDYAWVQLDEGLRVVDAVTLHANATGVLLSKDQFSLMKDGALVLNSARGHLIDEDALIDALGTGKIRGAWLDVFWEEPYHGRLLAHDNVLLTPHISTYTRGCRRTMECAAVENLLRDLDKAREGSREGRIAGRGDQ